LGRSNNNASTRFIVLLDRAVLCGLALGLALYVLPIWREGRLRSAFWVTLVSTLLHIYTSHKRST
jgi:uncharacterized membrane protein YccC